MQMDATQQALLDELRRIPVRHAAADQAELALIQAARSAGLSWSQVADALRLATRQAAEQRQRRLLQRVRSEVADADPPAPAGVMQSTRSGATHWRIVEAAARVLAERGYVSSRMSDIVATARLKAASLYHYFASKDDLVAEVLRYGVHVTHHHVRSVLDELPQYASAATRLDAAMMAHMRAVLELNAVGRAHPHVYAQAPDSVRQQVRPSRRAYGALWEQVIDDAVQAGVLRTDVDVFVLRLFLVNSLEAVNQWFTRSHIAPGELSRLVRRMLMEGVAGQRSVDISADRMIARTTPLSRS